MSRSRRWTLAGLVMTLSLAGCGGASPPLPTRMADPAPRAERVERVLFLIGDAGGVTTSTSPLLRRLGQDVEEWSGRLASDSSVAVLVLGDIRYPVGLHSPDSEDFARDTAVVMSQVRVVAGPNARRHGARAFFVPGNHDWGLREELEGVIRLRRLDEFLELARRRTGAVVGLEPEPGTGGPLVVDWGRHTRLLLLDTAWWLLGAEEAEKAAFLEAVEKAMRSRGERDVVFAAHHPFRSVGEHGGTLTFGEELGLGYVIRRSGALLQSLNSRPYRDLERAIRAIFGRTGPPFAFVGGHDHSLQVMGAVEPTDPLYSIVSGSVSEVTGVGPGPGLHFARSAPGYVRLLIEEDGGVHLAVVAAPERFLRCPGEEAPHDGCMAEGMAAFETVHSQRLR